MTHKNKPPIKAVLVIYEKEQSEINARNKCWRIVLEFWVTRLIGLFKALGVNVPDFRASHGLTNTHSSAIFNSAPTLGLMNSMCWML